MSSSGTMARCKPGDLAVVIRAQHEENLGRVVRVAAPERGQSGYRFPWEGVTWWVDVAEVPLVWLIGGKPHAMFHGPVADHCLQPLRGSDGDYDIVF